MNRILEWFWERAFLAGDTDFQEPWGENKPEIFSGNKRSVCRDRGERICGEHEMGFCYNPPDKGGSYGGLYFCLDDKGRH